MPRRAAIRSSSLIQPTAPSAPWSTATEQRAWSGRPRSRDRCPAVGGGTRRAIPGELPENLGEPINSASDEFCPTPVRGGGLFFVSREALPGSCGLGDIYFTRYNPTYGWSEPRNLGCAPDGPNTGLDEQGPSYVENDDDVYLFFSSGSAVVPGDIYVSRKLSGWNFGGSTPVAGLNDPAANDIQPNVRKDGLEVVFSSNRAGTLGAQDIWASTRDDFDSLWSAPSIWEARSTPPPPRRGPPCPRMRDSSCSAVRRVPRA
jgi:hypothetical protein